MKKVFAFLSFLFVCVSVFSVSFTDNSDSNPTSLLNEYYGSFSEDDNDDYWSNVRISLITVSKGKELYSWFGHSALMVERPDGPALMYDWGRFSFGKDFYRNFVFGKLLYKCGVAYASSEFEMFASEHRAVSKIELNLSAARKKDMVSFLNFNSSEEYNTYLYRYLDDNCSTRVRDLINEATDGHFELWAKKKSGYSYRTLIFNVMKCNIPLAWVYDFLQNGTCDEKQTLWEEMFLPENLANGVRMFEDIAGSEESVSDFVTEEQDIEKNNGYYIVSFLTGLLLSVLAVISCKTCKFVFRLQAFLVNAVLGVLGSILLFADCFTLHDIMYFNENLIFINPLLFVIAVESLKFEKHRNSLKILYGLLSCFCVVLIILKIGIPSVFRQNNLAQLLTVFPYYTVNALLLSQ